MNRPTQESGIAVEFEDQTSNIDSEKIDIGIIGGAGYTAGELIRLLSTHPKVDSLFVQSQSLALEVLSLNQHKGRELLRVLNISFLCYSYSFGTA